MIRKTWSKRGLPSAVIDELNRYVRGWLNYFKLSSTYSEVKDLAEWVRRRVRLSYWTTRRGSAMNEAKPDSESPPKEG